MLPIDPYVVDTLMRDLVGHDRQPSAFLVYVLLYRRTVAVHRLQATIALQDIAEFTGLSKRSVQNAVAHLADRKLVTIERESATSVATYGVLRPWRRAC
jgi:DNA-binding GntR family transcriptional regulator